MGEGWVNAAGHVSLKTIWQIVNPWQVAGSLTNGRELHTSCRVPSTAGQGAIHTLLPDLAGKVSGLTPHAPSAENPLH